MMLTVGTSTYEWTRYLRFNTSTSVLERVVLWGRHMMLRSKEHTAMGSSRPKRARLRFACAEISYQTTDPTDLHAQREYVGKQTLCFQASGGVFAGRFEVNRIRHQNTTRNRNNVRCSSVGLKRYMCLVYSYKREDFSASFSPRVYLP